MVILTHPQEVADTYKDTTLTHDTFVRNFFNQLGVTPVGMRKLFQDPRSFPAKEKSSSMLQNENPLHKAFANYQSELYKQQLHPGERLDVLQPKVLHYVNDSLQWDNLPSQHAPSSATVNTLHPGKIVSLSEWCREVLVKATARSFFGDAPLDIDPNFLQNFYDFDDVSWKITYNLPYLFAREAHASKDKLLDVLVEYLNLPHGKKEAACWLIKMLEKELREIGVGDRDIAAMLLLVFWVSSTNAHKLTFWILAHIIHSPSLLSTIRIETSPAFATLNPNLSHLLTSTPTLTSLYHELLRLNSSAALIRDVEHPITIGGKHLRKGMKILSPFRQMHLNEDLFGADAGDFDAERFLKNKSLALNKSYKPFGGGSTMCAGRFLARQEIYTFVALVLRRFEVSLVQGEGGKRQVFPELERKKPSLGVMGSAEGYDVVVSVRPQGGLDVGEKMKAEE